MLDCQQQGVRWWQAGQLGRPGCVVCGGEAGWVMDAAVGGSASSWSEIPAELDERVEKARAELEQALADLRAQLSDDEVLAQFGVDLSRFGA